MTFLERPNGILRREAGLHVLYLSGTWEEMATAHAALLKEEIRTGLIPFFGGFIERHMKHGPLGAMPDSLRRFAADLMESQIAGPIERALPAEQRAVLAALAAETGYTVPEVARVLSLPDAAAILTAFISESGGKALSGLGRLKIEVPGCSAVVLGPPHTKNRHLLHARNLDYDCLGTWDTHRVVSFNAPKGELKHVAFTTAGAFTSGLTGMNEAGLFLGCNVSPTWDVRPNGQAFHALQTRILSEAHNVEEAVEILRSTPRASGFNLHLSHGPSGTGCVVEYSGHHAHVRWLRQGRLCATNHYAGKKMQQYQLDAPAHTHHNSHARLDRLEALTADLTDATVADMANLMRDRLDPALGRHRPVGHIVASPLNVQSIVADVTAGETWVSNGLAPAVDSDYMGFNLHEHFNDPGAPIKKLKGVRPVQLSTEQRGTVDLFKQSYMAYIHEHDLAKARGFMVTACAADPGEPAFPMLAAMLSLQMTDMKNTRRHAKAALKVEKRPFQRAQAMTMVGYTLEAEEDRSKAVTWYQKALDTVGDDSAALVSHLRKLLTRPFGPSDLKGMRIEYMEPSIAGF